MLITGYHGTTEQYAHSILREGKFRISRANKEWLGHGIYFYEKFADAFSWKPQSGEEKAVLHSVIRIPDDAFLDLDTDEGAKAWQGILDYLCQTEKIKLTGTAQENQCAACNMLWDSNPDIMVLAGSFAAQRSKVKVLLDRRIRRREFCVRDNQSIKSTQIIAYKE